MEATGTIEITENRDIRGHIERVDYRWLGPSIAKISYYFTDMLCLSNVSVGDIVTIGPYRLKIIANELWNDVFVAIRMEGPFWRLRYLWHRYNKSFDLAYRRFIVTLALWHLAEYSPAAIPSWRDIYFVKRVRSLKMINLDNIPPLLFWIGYIVIFIIVICFGIIVNIWLIRLIANA